jgi:hypothetical protein
MAEHGVLDTLGESFIPSWTHHMASSTHGHHFIDTLITYDRHNDSHRLADRLRDVISEERKKAEHRVLDIAQLKQASCH